MLSLNSHLLLLIFDGTDVLVDFTYPWMSSFAFRFHGSFSSLVFIKAKIMHANFEQPQLRNQLFPWNFYESAMAVDSEIGYSCFD